MIYAQKSNKCVSRLLFNLHTYEHRSKKYFSLSLILRSFFLKSNVVVKYHEHTSLDSVPGFAGCAAGET